LLVARALTGLAEGVTFPVMHALISRWSPPQERTFISTFIYTGANGGTAIAMPLTAVLSERYGWPFAFYAYGLAGLVWCAAWFALAADSPSASAWMSQAEKAAIVHSQGGQLTAERPPVPYRSIFSCAAFYAILLAHVANNYGNYTLLTELPTYMKEVLHFKLRENGFLSALPYLIATFTSPLVGYAADWLRRDGGGRLSTLFVRRLFTFVGLMSPAASFAVLGFASSNTSLVVVLLCLNTGLNTFGVKHIGTY